MSRIEEVLVRGTLCHLAAVTARGPHVTPVVYVAHAGRLWATTARRTVKARAWRRDPATAGLVILEDQAVAFRGDVTTFDILDPATWKESALQAPVVAAAAARFSAKNARFFAGYARDAHRVPLSWTPPGRVFAGIEIHSAALLDLSRGRVVERRDWPLGRTGPPSSTTARNDLKGWSAARTGLPPDLLESPGWEGTGVAGIAPDEGLTVLPATWSWPANGVATVRIPAAFLRLAGAQAIRRVSLTVDHAHGWRARSMAGWSVRGALTGADRSGRSVDLRLQPDRAVWWKGWDSGTVAIEGHHPQGKGRR